MAITADVYGHPDEEALKEAARKMGTVLGEGGDGRDVRRAIENVRRAIGRV